MVARDLLRQDATAEVLEDDEVAHEVEEAALLEDPFEDDLERRQAGRRVLPPADRAPGLEPLAPRAERTDPRLHPVGHDQRRVVREQGRDLRLVRLELLEGGPDRGVLVGRVLELDDRERQPVHEQHDVRAAGVLTLGHGELVDREPVVVLRRVEVDDARLRPGDRAVRPAVLDRDPVHEHPVDGAVASYRARHASTQ